METYALYDLNNGYYGITHDEATADAVWLSGGSAESIQKTHIKCDICRMPTKKLSDTTCECLNCTKLFSLNKYKTVEVKTNEYAVFQNGHYRMFLYLSDDNMWTLTNGEHIDVQKDLGKLCARNGIRIPS